MNTFYLFTMSIYVAFSMAAENVANSSGIPEYATLCPYSNFCASNATKSLASPKYKSCCQKCSCYPSCHLVGSCCPDVQNNIAVTPKYECRLPTEILNYPRNVPDFKRERTEIPLKYHIIDDCPTGNLSEAFSACENPKSLEDYVFVSDAENESVYSNRACAFCHRITDVVEWTLVAKCPAMFKQNFRTLRERDDFVLESCPLDIIPPNEEVVEMAGCFSESNVRFFINSCERSEQNDTNQKQLEKACSKERPNMNTLFSGSGKLRAKTFSNIYCYLCNTQDDDKEIDVCKAEERNIWKLPSSTGFSGILASGNDAPTHGEKRCLSWELWDGFSQVCRPIQCKFTEIPVNGKCEDVFSSVYGLNVFALFEVGFKRGNTTDSTALLYQIESHMERYLGNKFMSTCGVCNPTFFRPPNSLITIFELQMYTSEYCSMSYLIGQIKSLVTGGLKRSIQLKETEIYLNFTRKNLTAEKSITSDHMTYSGCFSEDGFQLVDLQSCSRFQMTVYEFKSIVKDRVPLHTSSDTSVIVDEDTGLVSVCTDYYFHLLARGNSPSVVILDRDCWIAGRAFPFYMFLLILINV